MLYVQLDLGKAEPVLMDAYAAAQESGSPGLVVAAARQYCYLRRRVKRYPDAIPVLETQERAQAPRARETGFALATLGWALLNKGRRRRRALRCPGTLRARVAVPVEDLDFLRERGVVGCQCGAGRERGHRSRSDVGHSSEASTTLMVLLTGFEPFGGDPTNSSQLVVEQLVGEVDATAILPVTASGAPAALRAAVERHRPDLLLSLGMAGEPAVAAEASPAPRAMPVGPAPAAPAPALMAELVELAGWSSPTARPTRRDRLNLERIAVNVLDFEIVDNDGVLLHDEPVLTGGPAAYSSTLPARAILAAWRGAGLPGQLSSSAGTFICNQVFYWSLHMAARHGHRAGFIHLPRASGQGDPCLPLAVMIDGVRRALDACRTG